MKIKKKEVHLKRFVWLNRLIRKHGWRIGAEIGTGAGRTGSEILRANPKLHLIQVAYYPEREGPLNHCTTSKAEKRWIKRMFPYKNRLTVLSMMSHEAAPHVKDNSLDFIFIDADHSYEHCIEDIRDWVPKVKQGGLISGHDYDQPDFPGVNQAVQEYFGDDFETVRADWIWYTWKK